MVLEQQVPFISRGKRLPEWYTEITGNWFGTTGRRAF